MPRELPTDPMQIDSIDDGLTQFATYQEMAVPGSRLDTLWLNCPAVPLIHACSCEVARNFPDLAPGLLIDNANADDVSRLVSHGYYSDAASLAATAWLLASGRDGVSQVAKIVERLRAIALEKLQYLEGIHRDDVARERQTLIPLARDGKAAQRQRSEAGFSSGSERRAARQPVWDQWQRRAEELHRGNTARSNTDIFAQVGREFDVTRRAVAKRVQLPGT